METTTHRAQQLNNAKEPEGGKPPSPKPAAVDLAHPQGEVTSKRALDFGFPLRETHLRQTDPPAQKSSAWLKARSSSREARMRVSFFCSLF